VAATKCITGRPGMENNEMSLRNDGGFPIYPLRKRNLGRRGICKGANQEE